MINLIIRYYHVLGLVFVLSSTIFIIHDKMTSTPCDGEVHSLEGKRLCEVLGMVNERYVRTIKTSEFIEEYNALRDSLHKQVYEAETQDALEKFRWAAEEYEVEVVTH